MRGGKTDGLDEDQEVSTEIEANRDSKHGIELPFPIIRITVLGASGVGKTRFIDAFINNAFACEDPDWYVPPRTDSEFFHRMIDLEPALGTSGNRVCVELEDTPPAQFIEIRKMLEGNIHRDPTYQSAYAEQLPREMHIEELQLQHPSARFLSMERAGEFELPEGIARLQPFSMFDYNRGFNEHGRWENKPLTQGRMGMLVMYDQMSEPTLLEAMEIYELIVKQKERRPHLLPPLVYFVGNKDDLVGDLDFNVALQGSGRDSSAIARALRAQADLYASRQRIQLHRVSATVGTRVMKTVKQMLRELMDLPRLIHLEIAPSRSGGLAATGEPYGTPPSSLETAEDGDQRRVRPTAESRRTRRQNEEYSPEERSKDGESSS